ncbi:amidohydrolase family protein [Nocardioides sp.]|uniref:amidohydrolase family protein n=1 Tax=Nocardioides sp. TaxID=35761 RepID=UPI0039E2EE7E
MTDPTRPPAPAGQEHVVDLAVVGGSVLTPAGFRAGMTVLVDDGVIAGIEDGETPVRARRVIRADRSAVIPGFVDSHTHIASNVMLRGLLEDTELFAWLDTMWRMKRLFDHETLELASLCGLIEMARSGITCFNEHFDGYAVRPQTRALEQVRLRATLGYGFADGGVYADVGTWSWWAVESFDEATAGVEADGDRVRLGISPHAVYSCSPELWRATRELATERGLIIHTHVAEGMREQQFMESTYGMTTVAWLDSLGVLGPDVTAAHCTQLSASDIAVLAERGVKVAHCPVCNEKLVSGRMDLKALIGAGVTVGLATDGPASHNTLDMFEEMKFAANIHKGAYLDPTFLTASELLHLATAGSARAMHRPELGTLTPGAPADLVVVDLDRAHTAPAYDVANALVYCSRADDVTHTVVAGTVVFDGEVVGVDEERTLALLRERAYALRDRVSDRASDRAGAGSSR